MMKKLFVLGIVLAMVMGLAAMAGAYQVSIQIQSTTSGSQQEVDMGDAGTQSGFPGATGNYVTAVYVDTSSVQWIVGVNPAAASAKVGNNYSTPAFTFDVWANGSQSTSGDQLWVWVDDNDGSIVGGTKCGLNNWVVTDITHPATINVPTLTKVNLAEDNVAADGAVNLGNITVGTASSPEVYTIAEVVPVPEPGSMVALFSGLVGLVGYGIRRRK